jgi:hypothetical protein
MQANSCSIGRTEYKVAQSWRKQIEETYLKRNEGAQNAVVVHPVKRVTVRRYLIMLCGLRVSGFK